MRSQEWLEYYRSMGSALFTVVDLETTGIRSYSDRVIEVSILHATLKDGILLHETYLINPGTVVPSNISRFTGITTAMVKDARTSLSVWTHCLPLLASGVLTAHNLSFDYGFLQQEYRRLGMSFTRPPHQQLCTVKLSRLLLSDLPSRSLPHLIKHFDFPISTSHRAGPDTLACWLLVKKLYDRILEPKEEAKILHLIGQQWLSEVEVAHLLNCSVEEVDTILSPTTVKKRFSQSRKGTVYLRQDIEFLTYW